MTKKLIALCIAVPLALSLSACSTEAPDVSLAAQGRPIINGELPDEPMHDAVVSLHQCDDTSCYANIFCSGTLIAPDVVLTAAHCLDVGRRKPELMKPENLAIYVGNNPVEDNNPEVHFVTETWMHPNYDSRNIKNDIAMVRLATPVTSVTPVPALPSSLRFTDADEGSLTLNFAGFGEDEHGNYDTKLQIDGTLGYIYSDTQIYYTQYSGGPCFGDSGGPAFVKRGGVAYVGGMTSYGDQDCAQFGISTRADAYEQEISAFIGTPPEPACYESADCDDGNECTLDTCQNPGTQSAACSHATVTDGTSCGVDGMCCTGSCGTPACSLESEATDCNDNEPLTADTCSNPDTCSATCVNTWPGCVDNDGYCGDGCTFDNDNDCEEAPTCGNRGADCNSNADCCSDKCHHRKHTCL